MNHNQSQTSSNLSQESLFLTFSSKHTHNLSHHQLIDHPNIVESQWRLNKFMDDYEEMKEMEDLKLTHATSLELSCIEHYGKQLADSYALSSYRLNQAISPQELQDLDSLVLDFQDESQLKNYVSNCDGVCEEDKNILLLTIEQNMEGREILMSVARHTPMVLLSGALKLASVIFKNFEGLKISSLDVTEIRRSLSTLQSKIIKQWVDRVSQTIAAIETINSEWEIKNLVISWMNIIASVLKGLYENPLGQKQDIIDEFQSPIVCPKMVKMNKSTKC